MIKSITSCDFDASWFSATAKKEQIGEYEFIAIQAIEDGKEKYYYNLNKDGKTVAYVIGRREPHIPIFTVEQLFSAPGTGKRATVATFNELLPRVEQDLCRKRHFGIQIHYKFKNGQIFGKKPRRDCGTAQKKFSNNKNNQKANLKLGCLNLL